MKSALVFPCNKVETFGKSDKRTTLRLFKEMDQCQGGLQVHNSQYISICIHQCGPELTADALSQSEKAKAPLLNVNGRCSKGACQLSFLTESMRN